MGGWSVTLIDPAQVVFKMYVELSCNLPQLIWNLTVPVTHANSPSTMLRDAMSQHSKILTTALICYTTSATAFMFFHVISSPKTPNGGLRFFVKSKYALPEFLMMNVLTL